MRADYTPSDWFWIVDGGDETRAYSSAAAAFVPLAEAPPERTSRASEASLLQLLIANGLPQGLDLRACAANRRWQKEVGGCEWNGHIVDTDRESGQPKLLAEFVAIAGGLRADPSPWKFKNGDFLLLSNADMALVCLTVRNFVAELFATEEQVLAAIDAGTVSTVAAVDAAFA